MSAEVSVQIVPLDRTHAATAAELHAAGQPGTFLTSLGPAFLRALYTAIPASPYGFGFAALDPGGGEMIGVVAGSTNTSDLFRDIALRQVWRIAPPVALRLARHPTLLPKILQTLTYPAAEVYADAGELLFIGVRPVLRSRGIGAQLYTALLEECRRRGIAVLTVLVDATNEGANRFYRRHGFQYDTSHTLFGRTMHFYHVHPLDRREC